MWNARRRHLRSLLGAALLLGLACASDAAGEERNAVAGEIRSITLTAAPAEYSGACHPPVRVQLTGKIGTTGRMMGIKAQFRFADGTPIGPIVVVNAPAAGDHVVPGSLLRTATWSDSVRLHVLYPGPKVSDAIRIKGSCVVERAGPAVSLQATPRTDGIREERFRVTATGFVVWHQSNESLLETYGAGDEVKLVSWSAECIMGGGARALPIVRTHAYGDLDGTHDFSRIQAGRGNGRSRGGLTTGDSVPQPGIPQVPGGRAGGRAVTEKFPIVLWEGVLRDGPGVPNNMVVLMPTLWELDDSPNDFMPAFGSWANDFPGSYGERVMHEDHPWGATQWQNVRDLVDPGMWRNRWTTNRPDFGDFSRPLGLNGVFGRTTETAAYRTHPLEVYWIPHPVRLTLYTALYAATSRPDFYVQFRDHPDYGGDYALSLHVDLLPR